MINLSKPDVGSEEIEAVLKVLQSDQLALGPVTKAFEAEFAKTVGAKYAVALNSGTSGLHVAVRAAGIGEGDEVITTPFSFIASANCILFEKATPVFVDIELDTLGLDPQLIESKINEHTKGIVPVHVFGQACQIDAVQNIANQHQLHVIEDACESPLATRNEKLIGSFGNCAVYGFYPNKQMTTGEGGMITTDDEALYDMYRSLRNQGRATNMQWLTHFQLGYNYRISEMTAAIGLAQTKKLPGFIKLRQEKAAYYKDILSEVNELTIPITDAKNNHTWFVFSARVKAEWRDEILLRLNEQGIQSKAYFSPCIHLQEFYKNRFGYRAGMFPNAEKVSNETIILPFHNRITETEMHRVRDELKKIISSLK